MEEIEMLVKSIANLPGMALWVIAIFYGYKVCVVGSIYGVIRFAITKLHDYLTTPKYELKSMELRPTIDGMCITGQADALIGQLHRLRGRGTSMKSQYIHGSDVDWLRRAIDAQAAADQAATKERANG